MPDVTIVLQLIGEGVTDIGPQTTKPVAPTRGVVATFVHKICGMTPKMLVRSSHYPHLQGKNLAQKVRFAKRQSFYNNVAGVVFVMDSEGIPEVINELTEGRDAELPDFPMAVAMAHPCIEAWLLCDPKAIQTALALPKVPQVPANPESLPAPQQNRELNPKTELKRIAGVESAAQKDAIVRKIKDLELLRKECPMGFAPFAAEIEQRIKPLFN